MVQGLGISQRLTRPFFVNGIGIMLRIEGLFRSKLLVKSMGKKESGAPVKCEKVRGSVMESH